MLQRKFRIGYTRAARLIDTMEEMKIIGPNIGSKPRDILMTSDQVYSRYFRRE
jgi:S-DNA-T family DNA segregation ATPase FtsK/SpoIIIE